MKREPDRKRGRHKRATSPETQRWEREHLPPACPSWMPVETWRRLVEMRNHAA